MKLTAEKKLARFSNEWTRSIYVGLSNEAVRELVAAGWLEKRQAPPTIPGSRANTATEYRWTAAGRAHLSASQPAPA